MSLLGSKEHHGQWGKCDAHGVRPEMGFDRRRLHASGIAPATPAIHLRIAIEDLSPEPGSRNAESVIRPGNRRKIADHQDVRVLHLTFSQETDGTLLAVMAVNPLVARRIAVEPVQRRFIVDMHDSNHGPNVGHPRGSHTPRETTPVRRRGSIPATGRTRHP